MELEDLISLNDAAAELGVAAVTLRAQASAGRLRAVRVGGTWVTTKDEVERYAQEQLGRRGRPAHMTIGLGWIRWTVSLLYDTSIAGDRELLVAMQTAIERELQGIHQASQIPGRIRGAVEPMGLRVHHEGDDLGLRLTTIRVVRPNVVPRGSATHPVPRGSASHPVPRGSAVHVDD